VDEKQHLYWQHSYTIKYKSYENKIPAGRSATLIALPTYDHDPDVKLGEDQILILWSIW